MGQNPSRGSEQVDISVNHIKFTNCKLIRMNDQQMLKTVIPCDQKAYKLWKDTLSRYKPIEHQFLILPSKYSFESSAVCATRGSLEMQFENYPYLLTNEIYNRKANKVPFTEPQLWYLLYAYLSAKKYLQANFQRPYSLLGDIRPDNVFISQNGKVKFSCFFSWPGQKLNYKKTFDGITTYLSPQDYELLNLGTMNNEPNLRSQMFSIGLTLVSASILMDNSDLYNVDKMTFDEKEATKRINKFKCLNTYSELFKGVISSCCQFQWKNRLQLNDLWLWIIKYEKRIMTKQPFMIQQLPTGINLHINRLRAQVLALQPELSILNLTSIRSLKSSHVNNMSQGNSRLLMQKSSIKYLKEINDIEGSQMQNERKSKIIINSGQQNRKIFYSPNNNWYFQTKNIENQNNYQNQQLKAVNAINPQYNGKTSTAHGEIRFEGRKVMKSPQGYYSPKVGVNQFRVFIQYKSPVKPIQKPFAQTLYMNNQNVNNVIKVESVKNNEVQNQKENTMFRKNSDSLSQKSHKSNSSNRQNRFVEGAIKEQVQNKQIVDRENGKVGEEKNVNLNEQTQQQISFNNIKPLYKKESPIHQIINIDSLNNGISQMVSQEVLIERREIKVANKSQQEARKVQNLENEDNDENKNKDVLIGEQIKGSEISLGKRISEQHKQAVLQQVQKTVEDMITPIKKLESRNELILNNSEQIQVKNEVQVQQVIEADDREQQKRVREQEEQQQKRLKQEEEINRLTYDIGHRVIVQELLQQAHGVLQAEQHQLRQQPNQHQLIQRQQEQQPKIQYEQINSQNKLNESDNTPIVHQLQQLQHQHPKVQLQHQHLQVQSKVQQDEGLKINCNVIEVHESQQPLPNHVQKDSDIDAFQPNQQIHASHIIYPATDNTYQASINNNTYQAQFDNIKQTQIEKQHIVQDSQKLLQQEKMINSLNEYYHNGKLDENNITLIYQQINQINQEQGTQQKKQQQDGKEEQSYHQDTEQEIMTRKQIYQQLEIEVNAVNQGEVVDAMRQEVSGVLVNQEDLIQVENWPIREETQNRKLQNHELATYLIRQEEQQLLDEQQPLQQQQQQQFVTNYEIGQKVQQPYELAFYQLKTIDIQPREMNGVENQIQQHLFPIGIRQQHQYKGTQISKPRLVKDIIDQLIQINQAIVVASDIKDQHENSQYQAQRQQNQHRQSQFGDESQSIVIDAVADKGQSYVEAVLVEKLQLKHPQTVKLEIRQAPLSNRRRTVKQGDFLDEVMQVNKIINHQEHKNYDQNNKYLIQHNHQQLQQQ